MSLPHTASRMACVVYVNFCHIQCLSQGPQCVSKRLSYSQTLFPRACIVSVKFSFTYTFKRPAFVCVCVLCCVVLCCVVLCCVVLCCVCVCVRARARNFRRTCILCTNRDLFHVHSLSTALFPRACLVSVNFHVTYNLRVCIVHTTFSV